MSVDNNVFVRELRVDGNTTDRSTFSTVKDACDFAATITPRDTFNHVLIVVNAGVYLELPFTIPSWTIVDSFGDVDEASVPSTVLIRDDPLAAETTFITCADNTVLSGMAVIAPFGALPVFLADYTLVSCGDNVQISRCLISQATTYTGPNIVSAIHSVGSILIVNKTTIRTAGSSTVTIRGNKVGAYYCFFSGNPDIAFWAESGNCTLAYCRMEDNPNDASLRPISFVVKNDSGVVVKLFSTRVPLNRRTGTYAEFHPTPKQLRIARKAEARTITFASPSGERSMDSYTDGTLYCDTDGGAYSAVLPPEADVITGEIFAITNTGTSANDVTATADVAINGAIAISDGESVSYQMTDTNVWWAL